MKEHLLEPILGRPVKSKDQPLYLVEEEVLEQLPRLILGGIEGKKMGWIDTVTGYFRRLYARLADRASTAYSEDARALADRTRKACWAIEAKCPDYRLNPAFYLGQLNAILELADRLDQRSIPLRVAQIVQGSAVARQILQALHRKDNQAVVELAKAIGQERHNYVSDVLNQLEDVGVVRRQRFGQITRVTLLPIGREIARELGEAERAVEPLAAGERPSKVPSSTMSTTAGGISEEETVAHFETAKAAFTAGMDIMREEIRKHRPRSAKLFVGNLSSDATEADLRHLFEQAGTVESVRIVRDEITGRPRDFGFVEMATAEEAVKAIELLNLKLFVNEIRVKPKRGKL